MTRFTDPTSSPPPSPVQPESATIAAVVPAASVETKQVHSDDRWSRWEIETASRNFVSERRFQIIAGVIATGVIAWLIWTT